jgi:2-polyprenyl-3-methyl-5-hydroxy-6-metoxy-1,4-benzoquinol methylase
MNGRIEILDRCRLLGLDRFVDVGCGPGFLLETLSEMGKSVMGVEINPHAREFMARRVIPSVPALSDLRAEDDWEVVMSWHFLEHIHDPRGAIAEMFDVASRAVMTHVPTNHGEYQNPDHLWHFQVEHIRRILLDFSPDVDTFDTTYSPRGTELKVTNLVGWIAGRP